MMDRYVKRDGEEHLASSTTKTEGLLMRHSSEAVGLRATASLATSHAATIEISRRRHESSLRSQEETGDLSLLPPSVATHRHLEAAYEVAKPKARKPALEKMAPTPSSKDTYTHPAHRKRANAVSISNCYHYSNLEQSKSSKSMASSIAVSFDDTVEESVMAPLDVDPAVSKNRQELASSSPQDFMQREKLQGQEKAHPEGLALSPPVFQRQLPQRAPPRPGATRIEPNGDVIDMLERQSSQMTTQTNGTSNGRPEMGTRQITPSTLDSDNGYLVNAELVLQGGDDGQMEPSAPIARAKVIGKDENLIFGIAKWKVVVGIATFLLLTVVATVVLTVMLVARPVDGPTTAAPSVAPTTEEQNDLFELLSSTLPQSSLTQLQMDKSSGQAQAFGWLIRDRTDRPQLYSQEFRLFQRYALATLFYATDGPNRWSNADIFLKEPDECTWFENLYKEEPKVCDDEGHVIDITLYLNNLKGTIPPDLVVLTRLVKLDLSINSLSGTIPPELFSLPKLTGFGLDRNSLSGTIPTEIGVATTLVYFDVDETGALVGTIPTEFGLLTSLTRLWLEYNRLTGTLPTELGLLTELTGLFVSENQLDLTLPTELGAISKLQELRAFDCGLSGLIPDELGQCTDLSSLRLSGNDLTGTLPVELFQPQGDCKLVDFGAERTKLRGNVPTELTFCDLDLLLLAESSFEGSIPTEMGQLVGLTDLRLNGNRFVGHLPSELGELERVGILRLHENDLSGTVPSELGMLWNITELWLQGNNLTGSVPAEICSLLEVSEEGNIFDLKNDGNNSTDSDDQASDDDVIDLLFDCGSGALDCGCLELRL